MSIIGEIRSFASGTNDYVVHLARLGWIPCDGRSLNRVLFPNLFREIGTAWGSKDPGNSFRVPDLRGLFLRGSMPPNPSEDLQKRDPNSAGCVQLYSGGAKGAAVGSFQDDSLGSHNHVLHTQRFGGDINFRADAQTYLGLGGDGKDVTEFMGGRETRPRNVYVFYAIFAGPFRLEDAVGEP